MTTDIYRLPADIAAAVTTNRRELMQVYISRTTDEEKKEMARLIADLLEDRVRTARLLAATEDKAVSALGCLKATVHSLLEAKSQLAGLMDGIVAPSKYEDDDES